MKKTCKCGSSSIEEITLGKRVAVVVGVSLDDGLVCDLKTFVPNVDINAVYYCCTHCRKVLPFTTKTLVDFLRGDW